MSGKMKSGGSVAAFFMNGGTIHSARPYFDKKMRPRQLVVVNGKTQPIDAQAALLRYDEWKDIDRKVLAITTQRLSAFGDLIARGLTHNLGSLGVTLAQWQTSSDMTPANIDMSGVTSGEEDTLVFGLDHVPVPIIHKDFRLNIRRLEASRRMGEGLDTLQAEVAGRLVAEASEDMLFSGNPIKVEGGEIFGYLNFPSRNIFDMNPWDTADNEEIVRDVSAMMQTLRDARHYGPYVLYIPGAWEFKMDEDYRQNDNRTLRQRLLALSGLSDIRIADRMAAGNVAMVQMTSDVVDLAIAQDVSTIQWNTMGGMVDHFKVMACWVPRLKKDYDGRCGILHGSVST